MNHAMAADMTAEQVTLWGIRAGRSDEGRDLFTRDGVVALRWSGTPDLSVLPDNREAFKELYREVFPGRPEGNVITGASQLYRFVHEIQVGDLVAYPSKLDRLVHLGRIASEYRFVAQAPHDFRHQRSVEWLKNVPRTRYSQGALYELGSALTLFQVRNYLAEHIAALEGRVVTPTPEQDETVSLVAEEIEATTRDFVLKTISQELKGHPFAGFVAHLLEVMGYRVRVSPPGPDGGVDVVAHRDELGFEPPIIKVQVKSTEDNVGAPAVQALYGNVDNSEFGLLVTLGDFTSQARVFANGKPNLRLIDGSEFVNLVLGHYEQMDSKYKGMLPLRRVYVPQAVDGE